MFTFLFRAGTQDLYRFNSLMSWIHKAMLIPYEMFTKRKVNYLPAHGKCTLYIHLGGHWHANGFCNLLLTRARSKQGDSNYRWLILRLFPLTYLSQFIEKALPCHPHYCHLPLSNQPSLYHEPQWERRSWFTRRSTKKVAGDGDPQHWQVSGWHLPVPT